MHSLTAQSSWLTPSSPALMSSWSDPRLSADELSESPFPSGAGQFFPFLCSVHGKCPFQYSLCLGRVETFVFTVLAQTT